MQITLELPDDVLTKAEAIAKQQSRGLGSLFAEFVRGLSPSHPTASAVEAGYRFPVSKRRPFTLEELDKALEEHGLP